MRVMILPDIGETCGLDARACLGSRCRTRSSSFVVCRTVRGGRVVYANAPID